MKKFLTIVALFGALSLAGVTAQAQDKPAEQPGPRLLLLRLQPLQRRQRRSKSWTPAVPVG